MSERKRVIRVNDLFIEADNVFIEPRRRGRDDRDSRVDPFFGGLRHRRDDDVAGAEESSSSSSSSSRGRHGDESSDRRRGFSWF
ncbi:hypothetical protein LCL89_06895 [Halobacillus yeomjeoni]|uniref:hypothetical protein n=1 Tax=Halobacillus yeomjeoni TaxID=311194 RepID=UPI001CD2D718|nr:hypothetical protein [Halobacillus yeomjeoni]MCA0983783.1 hypothetical protein [Halobacillus yeomjeoni]